MEIYGYVYMVRNKINGKIYFGITIYNFYIRYCGNIAKHTHNEHLQNSIKEYGIENFEINEQFDVAYNEDDLWDLEDMYICLYNTLDRRYGYNKKRSGSKHKGHGKMSEESIQKIREIQTERLANMSEEEKRQWGEKISKANKGDKNPSATKIICLETQQVFTTIKEAKQWLGKGDISKCCRGITKIAGKHPITGERLHWMYYSDYLEQQNKENSDTSNN